MGCAVVLGYKADGTTVSLLLDIDAEEVAKHLQGTDRLARFELKTGKSVWINPARVLFVESRDRPSRTSRKLSR